MDNNNESIKIRSGFFLTMFSLLSLIIFPLLIAFPILFGLLTCSEFYTSVLRNAGLIETYVEVSNLQVEKKLRREIEVSVHLEEFRAKYNTIKSLYEKKKENFDSLNRTEEFDRLKKQRDELSDLSYENAPDRFKSEAEFIKYKNNELENLERKIDEIKLHRDINKEAVEAAEDEMEDAEDVYDDARETLEDKMDEANDIIKAQKDSFSGEMHGDLEKISPALTKELNEKLINSGMKTEIEKYISFFTSYYEQKELGNVYVNRMDNYIQGFYGSASVKLPEFGISLYVEDEVNGVPQKRHLASDIFVEKIKNIPDLKLRNSFIQLFKFTESGLAEIIGESYVKEYNITISNGSIKFGPMLLTGGRGATAEYIMIAATWGRYLMYVLPAIALAMLVLLFLSPAEKNLGYRHIRMILILPSVAIVLFSLMMILFSGSLLDLFPEPIAGPVLLTYLKSIARVISLHLFAPLSVIFAMFAVFGLLLRRRKNKTE